MILAYYGSPSLYNDDFLCIVIYDDLLSIEPLSWLCIYDPETL